MTDAPLRSLEAAFRQAGWRTGVHDALATILWLAAFAAYLDTLKRR